MEEKYGRKQHENFYSYGQSDDIKEVNEMGIFRYGPGTAIFVIQSNKPITVFNDCNRTVSGILIVRFSV